MRPRPRTRCLVVRPGANSAAWSLLSHRSAHRNLDLTEAINAAGHHLAPLDRAERADLLALLTKITAELPQPTRS